MHHNEPILTQNNLDTPHLYWLHDGSIPPIESLGCNRKNIGAIGLRFFTDDCGVGHIGKTSKKVTKQPLQRPKKRRISPKCSKIGKHSIKMKVG